MKHTNLILTGIFSFCLLTTFLQAQPAGFTDELHLNGFNQATGLTFDNNGRMYVWEKEGKVWVVENGQKRATPLVDISEEVGNWRDFGLLSVVLDPNFLNNGHIYLLYLVDRHHLLNFGTSAYNPNTDTYFSATIGRLTRYTATASSGFNTVDYNTRKVLFGESPSTGMPSLHQSHGMGGLVFGTDGSLLVTLGDGASYSLVDEGSASGTYWSQALQDGIIRNDENVGAYRCQMDNSFNGKILRIDPATGDGLPSNPNFNPSAPRSAASRTWAKGVRNPYRICLRPETGSHDIQAGDPGDFYFGDVGWSNREELNVMDAPGLNFGWPRYEGMTYMPGYDNPSYAPATHALPKVDWRNSTPRAHINGSIYNVGSTSFPGTAWQGNASTGGVWYNGEDFPANYQNTYFHADYGGRWIKMFKFDQQNNPISVENFLDNLAPVVHLATSPVSGGLYYVAYPDQIRKISFIGTGPQDPIAKIKTSIDYGTSPLTVTFDAGDSYDPQNGQLVYSWDFGDGSPLNVDQSPSHTFLSSNNNPNIFTVTLTVTNPLGASSTATKNIHLNNTPPQITSTSLDNISTFSSTQTTSLSLSATVTDNQSPSNQLSFQWLTSLYHNNHNHNEPIDNNRITSTQLSPVGCDGATYWYRITLTVTDPQGLSTSYYKDLFPNCSGANQIITFAGISDKLTTDGPFTINPSSSSGLPVATYAVDGPARISGNQVVLTGLPGQVTLRATQAGNGTYAPALPLERSFRVSLPASSGPSDCSNTGTISMEKWTGISGLTVDLIPVNNPPDETASLSSFEIPVDADDNYGTRVRGYICPPESGQYRFWIASDDNGELWLSTDDSPANKRLIANVPGWSSSREWTKFPEQRSSLISLQSGQRYYIEALQKEQGGLDNLAVGWQRPGGTLNRPIQGTHLLPWDGGAPSNTAPDIQLTTASASVSGPFVVVLNASETISGLTLNDFNISNATATNLMGSNSSYTLTINPLNSGTVSVQLPAGTVADQGGLGNTASNVLSVTYTQIITCDNIITGGTINGDETNCGSFDPSTIENNSFPSGGSGSIEYSWQFSQTSGNGPWISIPSTNSSQLNPSTITQTHWYRRTARRSGCTSYTGISNVIEKTVESCGGPNPPSGYCTQRGTTPWQEWIEQVVFGDIDNVSFKEGYGDFKDQATSLSQGSSYPISLTPGLSWPGYQTNLFWRVWIDYNRDGDFDDLGELVLEENNISQTVNGLILIPGSAQLGGTIMRIAVQKGSYAEVCESFGNGEVEDYRLDIVAGNGSACFISTSTSNINCDDNGTENDPSDDTFSGLITVSGSGTGSSWSGGSLSGAYDQPIAFGPYPISSGNITINITDIDDSSCSTNLTLRAPATCSNGSVPPGGYCASRGTTPWQEWIARVQFANIDNETFKGGYEDHTDVIGNVAVGASYPIALNPGLSWAGHQADMYWRAWIDYNRDGDFTDAGELVFEQSAVSIAVSGTVSIPSSASSGSTRMRISARKGSYADPCEVFGNGEVEDYTVVIGNGNGGGDVTSPTVTLGSPTIISNGPFDVSADFSETVTGLTISDFSVVNGTASNLNGNGSSYSLTINPTSTGDVTISLPAGAAQDGSGNQNLASNQVTVYFEPSSNPTLLISSPASGQVITGTQVLVEFSTQFTTPNLNDHVLLSLDGGPEVDVHGTNSYTFQNVSFGQHLLTATLADANHSPLSNPEASKSVSFTTQDNTNPGGASYCTAVGEQPWQEWIERVEFGNIDNESFKERYGDFTDLSANVLTGQSLQLSVTPGFSYFQWDEHISAWIDYNQDGDFSDPGELVLNIISPAGSPLSTVLPVSQNITIPTTALTGNTRLRIAMQKESDPLPCGNLEFGEVEDYTVNISSGNNFSSRTPSLLLRAKAVVRAIELEWATNVDDIADHYTIERSVNGIDFYPIRKVNSYSSASSAMMYTQRDDQPASGENYYRIRMITTDGTALLSTVEKVIFLQDLNQWSLFPNPSSGEIWVDLSRYSGKKASIQVTSEWGEVLESFPERMLPDQPFPISLERFAGGLYALSIRIEGHKLETRYFIINKL